MACDTRVVMRNMGHPFSKHPSPRSFVGEGICRWLGDLRTRCRPAINSKSRFLQLTPAWIHRQRHETRRNYFCTVTAAQVVRYCFSLWSILIVIEIVLLGCLLHERHAKDSSQDRAVFSLIQAIGWTWGEIISSRVHELFLPRTTYRQSAPC
jgi:hypothetical protein